MKSLLVVLALAVCSFAQTSNPCNTNANVQTQPINIGSATTTQLIAAPASGKALWICGIMFTAASGTAATYQLEYGTGASCGSGTTVLTGAMAGNGGAIAYGATIPLPLINAFCMVTGGTGPSAQGIVTYVTASQ